MAAGRTVSLYSVHRICWRVRKDSAFREELRSDPAAVLDRFALTGAERVALLAGDVAGLERMGAHGYLLGNLGRFGIGGLDRASYVRRMKGVEGATR
jgi:hypothetical protein